MPQRLLTASQEKTARRVAFPKTRPTSARSFQNGLHPLLQLQLMVGNRNVAQLIQARRLTEGGKMIGLRRKLTVGAAAAELLRRRQRGERAVRQRDALQRAPKEEEKVVPQDFAVLLSPDKDFVTLASAIAPGAKVLHATSVDDLAKQLKAIKVPVGTLYFVAHMNEDGDLLFTSPGKLTYVPAEAIAAKIMGSAQVESIDFRGCSIAQAPAEMNKIRVALKATRITGSTCTFVKQVADPIKIGGKAITRPEHLNDKKVKSAFDAGFKKLHELFVDAKKKCIINDSVDGYFQTGGRLIAVWVNPGSMAEEEGWDDNKSICYKDLKVEKVDPTKKLPVIGPDDCKLVEVGKK